VFEEAGDGDWLGGDLDDSLRGSEVLAGFDAWIRTGSRSLG
jgi:hypothetical protein